MFIFSLRGDLPAACLTSFITDATGEISRWRLVQFPPLRDRRGQRPGPRHRTVYLRVAAALRPQRARNTKPACTANSVAVGTQRTCQPVTLRIAMWRCQRSRPVGGLSDGLPRSSVPPQWQGDHTQSRKHAMAGPHEDPLTASSGRPSEERGTRSRGLISPSRRRGSYPVVPTRVTEVHISSTSVPYARPSVPGTGRRSSRGAAPHRKTSPAAQRTGGHRRVATGKTTAGAQRQREPTQRQS